MAKDDYNVILCRLLIYLYAVLKRRILFDQREFDKTVVKGVNADYFTDVLRMAQDEGLIKGVTAARPWGGSCILLSEYNDLEITPAGIRYLEDNKMAKKALKTLREAADIIVELASAIGIAIPL